MLCLMLCASLDAVCIRLIRNRISHRPVQIFIIGITTLTRHGSCVFLSRTMRTSGGAYEEKHGKLFHWASYPKSNIQKTTTYTYLPTQMLPIWFNSNWTLLDNQFLAPFGDCVSWAFQIKRTCGNMVSNVVARYC